MTECWWPGGGGPDHQRQTQQHCQRGDRHCWGDWRQYSTLQTCKQWLATGMNLQESKISSAAREPRATATCNSLGQTADADEVYVPLRTMTGKLAAHSTTECLLPSGNQLQHVCSLCQHHEGTSIFCWCWASCCLLVFLKSSNLRIQPFLVHVWNRSCCCYCGSWH